jgi:competence protein ComEA
MKKLILSFFLFLFFAVAWFGRYQNVELSAIHPSVIQVEVKGEVKNPGVYTIKFDGDVQDAIDAAGGLNENADISALSLVRTLKDKDVVVVAGKAQEDVLRVSINTASLEELCELPGIGPAIAQRIIDYRTITPFSALEDLMDVKGIGEKTFEKLEPYIVL